MEEYRLRESGVEFDPATHTYDLNGKPLEGITGMIHRQLFPDMYSDVPQAVLARAAERGHIVHEACELWDDAGIDTGAPEVASYRRIADEAGLRHEYSEYLVTDGERFASAIDKVYRTGAASFHLSDIKTTYALNEEYVRWQLSIYAALFERQNPGAEVSGLSAIWLRGDKSRRVEIDRIPAAEAWRLMEAEAAGERYRPAEETLPESSGLPDKYRRMEAQIVAWETEIKELTDRRKALLDGMLAEMEKAGVKKWESGRIRLTYVAATERRTVDTARLQKEMPEIAERYKKTSAVKPSVKLTILTKQ